MSCIKIWIFKTNIFCQIPADSGIFSFTKNWNIYCFGQDAWSPWRQLQLTFRSVPPGRGFSKFRSIFCCCRWDRPWETRLSNETFFSAIGFLAKVWRKTGLSSRGSASSRKFWTRRCFLIELLKFFQLFKFIRARQRIHINSFEPITKD